MPGRPVHENGGVGLFGNRATDLFEMKVHGFGIGERQHQGRTGIAGRADGAEQVGGFVTLICGLAWPGALSGPDAGSAILLADARFVLKPNLYCLACGHMAQVGSEDVGEVMEWPALFTATAIGGVSNISVDGGISHEHISFRN